MTKAIVIVVFGLVFAGLLFTTEDPNPDREYCEMVQLYKDSAGEMGWAAYKGEDMCHEYTN